MVAAALFPDLEASWFSIREDDPRALALYLRHYSSSKARGSRAPRPLYGNEAKFVGPGASLVLLTASSEALFVWRKQDYRKDGQIGVECSIFRNESDAQSSDLIREADALAWDRWPGQRLFTYVDPSKVRRKRDPGRCFRKAGWQLVRDETGTPVTSTRGLLIFECLPETSMPSTPLEGHRLDRAAGEIPGMARHDKEARDVGRGKARQATVLGRRPGGCEVGRAATSTDVHQTSNDPDPR